MTTKPIRVGGDFGNSQSTLAIPAGRGYRTVTIPSFLGRGSLDELQRMRRGGGHNAIPSADATHDGVLTVGGVEQFVGQLALDQSPDANSARGDVHRYWAGHTRKLLLTLAGLAWEKIPPLYLTTGLPVAVWSAQRDAQVRRSLIGEHRFTFNGVERVLEVRGVFTMMEGAGALARLGSDDAIPQAVADGGGASFDLFYAIGQEPVIARCAGKHGIGVERIGELVAAEVARTYDRALTPPEIRALLWAYARTERPPVIYANRRRISLNGELRAADDAVGSAVATFISQTWASGNTGAVAAEVAQLYLIGGIAYFPEVRAHLRRLVGNVAVSERPADENALGYCAAGQSLTDADWAELS